MAGSSRDLLVNIDGDPQGFDRAFLSAKESAEVFDRELEKLERQQVLQEAALKRTTEASDRFSRSQGGAADSARKMGLAAGDAADRADAALRRAADASDKLARGELTAEQAAQLEAKAMREVERAAIAQAAAQREAAKQAEEQARAEAKAARDALEAAATQRLAELRSQGDIKTHNSLLSRLRSDYQGFGTDIKEMQNFGQRAFSMLSDGAQSASKSISAAANEAASSGPLMFYGILAALVVLPALSVAAAGALTLGLGGALALVGIKGAASAAAVKAAFGDMTKTVGDELKRISVPFQATLIELARVAASTFVGLEPTLASVFSQMAPRIQAFGQELGQALLQFKPAIAAVGQGFDQLLAHLGPALPTIIGSLSNAITDLAQTAGSHAQEFTQMALSVALLVEYFSKLIAVTGDLMPVVSPLSNLLDAIGIGGQTAATGTQQTSSALIDMSTAADQAQKAVSDLDDAIKRIVDPSLAVYNDTTRLSEGFRKLSEDLKASGGSLSDQTKESDAARAAFSAQIKEVAQLTADQAKLTGNVDAGNAVLRKNIPILWELAGSNRGAQDQVRALARVLGVELPADTKAGKAGVDAVKRAIDGVHSKTVSIGADVGQALANISSLQNAARDALGALSALNSGHARGGLIGGYASGGLPSPGSGMFHGAGSGTSDSNEVSISDGEYIVNAASTRKYLPLLEAINFGGPRSPSPAASVSAMRAAPSRAGGGGVSVMRLEITSGGSRFDDVLVEVIRNAVRQRGGDVQQALGPN